MGVTGQGVDQLEYSIRALLESSVYIGAKLTSIFSNNFFCYHFAIMVPFCDFVKVHLPFNFVQTPILKLL